MKNFLDVLEFSILKKVDVLNLDPALDLKLENLKVFDYKNKINFLCLIEAVILSILKLNFKNFRQKLENSYFYIFCKKLNPYITIGNEIDKKIFKFKSLFPKKIAICFQMSLYRNEHKFLTKKRLENYSCDYFLTYDKWHTNYFDFIKSKFLQVGSVKANNKKLEEKEKIYDIMFISHYRENSHIDPIKYYYASSKLFMVNNYWVFNKIAEFCKKNNKKLCLALTSNRPEKINKISFDNELKFFKSINSNFYYEKNDSFELAKKSKLVISVESTLGIELFYLGFKVLFINPLGFLGTAHIFDGKPEEGDFWFNNQNLNNLGEKISKLIHINENEYKDIVLREDFEINHDPGNSKLIEIINKHKTNE